MEHLSTSVQVCIQVISNSSRSFGNDDGNEKKKTSHSTMLANNPATALVARHLSKYGELII